MSQKKPHAEWQASVAKAVKLVENGWSIRGAAKKTGLPKSTVADHCGKFKGFDTRKGPERCLSETEETGLVNYTLYMAEHGFPLTRKVIKSLCVDIIKKSGRTTLVNLEKGPSDKWVKKFLNRHQELSERVPHVIDRARASVSVSAFRIAGLFPVNKEAVAAIPGPSKCHSEPVSVSQQTPDQPDVCDGCGHVTDNPLVRLGVIPPELASILVEPPAITKPNSKCPRCEKARVITDPEPADDHETEDFVVTDILPMEEPEDFSQTSCVLCGSGTKKWKWIGCDRCEDYWVHYDCLTYEDRVDVDLSLIVGEPWFCGVCKEE